MLAKFLNFLQIQQAQASATERLVSVAGSFFGILLVVMISVYLHDQADIDHSSAAIVVASMGASAVLLFAAPHSPLSQPWPLVGSHLISAMIGVGCAMLIPSPVIAAAVAVSLAIGAMQVLRCLHPPGGATALAAVIGGDAVHSLGFEFVLTTVLINVLTILAVAVVFNYPFPWRRYPVSWSRKPGQSEGRKQPYPDISHADFVAAPSEIDTFIDITEDDLLRIYDLVTRDKKTTDP